MSPQSSAELLAEEIQRAHPEVEARVRAVAFDAALFDIEVTGPDWTATVSLSRDGNDARLMLDDYVFENLSRFALLEVVSTLVSRRARITIGRTLVGKAVKLEVPLESGPRTAKRAYAGHLSRWEKDLSS